jgi:hypothetical protein
LYSRRKRSGSRQERTIGTPTPALYRACGAAAPERRKVSEIDDAREGKARESWSYSGEVWTDAPGRAVVVLPSFAGAAARFGYELTPVDQRRTAALGEQIVDRTFTIETDGPLVKVAWRVTPVREMQT